MSQSLTLSSAVEFNSFRNMVYVLATLSVAPGLTYQLYKKTLKDIPDTFAT